MNLWNQKHLPAPPTNTYKSKSKDLDLIKLGNALTEGINHFKNEDFMIRETAILSRILYRMKMKFRSSKDFKALEKINHSLNIYLTSKICSDLKNIKCLIPAKYFTATYLPTRNMLNYILVRIQGLSKLMERLYDSCQIAAREVHKRILLGHFWKIYLVLFSLVSRISLLVKYNTKFLCELYGKLLPHSKKLENPFRNWLPEGYQLPSDLREWLGVQWVYEEDYIDLTFEPALKILDFFDLVDDDDDDVQFCDEYVLIDEEDKSIVDDFNKLKPVTETLTRNRMRGFSINEDDIGEDIADIIKINDTIAENTALDHSSNDKEIKSYSNNIMNVEDVGQEISDQENDNNDRLETIKLVSVNTNHKKQNEIKEYNTVNNNDFTKLSKNKKDTNTYVTIDLVDHNMDSEVIVIPETPLKKSHNHLENTENQKEIESCLSIRNKNLDVEDIGEEISDLQESNEDRLETVTLDCMDRNHETGIEIKGYTKVNNNVLKKNSSRIKKDGNKYETISLVDDNLVSEVIVIPETPIKKSHNRLNDDSVIVVDNTLESEKLNNSLLDSSKGINKKKKKDQKLFRKALKNSARDTINSTFNSSAQHNDENKKSSLFLNNQIKNQNVGNTFESNDSVDPNIAVTPFKQKRKSFGDSSVIVVDNSANITPSKKGQKRKRLKKALKNFNTSIVSTDDVGDKNMSLTNQSGNNKDRNSLKYNWTSTNNKTENNSPKKTFNKVSQKRQIGQNNEGKPAVQIHDRLKDTSVIALDRTLVNTSSLSETLNDSILNSSKNIKKKKKKNRKIKEALKNSAVIDNKVKVNTNAIDQNISFDAVNSSISKNTQKRRSKKMLKTPLKDSKKIINSIIFTDSITKQNTNNISSEGINSPLSKKKQKREKKRMKQALNNSSLTNKRFTNYTDSVLDQESKNVSLNKSNTSKSRLKKNKKIKKASKINK